MSKRPAASSPLTSPLSSHFSLSTPMVGECDHASHHASSENKSELDATDAASPSSEDTPIKGPSRGSRLNELDKLLLILEMLQKWKWTVNTFLHLLHKHRSSHRVRQAHTHFLNFAYRDMVMEDGLAGSIEPRYRFEFMEHQGWTWAIMALQEELKALLETPSFGRFLTPIEGMENISLNALDDCSTSIAKNAPQWMGLLNKSCAKTHKLEPTGRHIVILSMLCSWLHPLKSTNFTTAVGLYLYQGGARRRVIDSFNRLGLITSYNTLQRRMSELSHAAVQKVRLIGRQPNAIVTYDNFDYAVGRRGERVGDAREFRSITTALTFAGQNIPSTGLQQHMWQPHQYPLRTTDMIQKLKLDEVEVQIQLYHIESAIKSLYSATNMAESVPWVAIMPTVEPIQQSKTIQFPMRPVMKDESTTSNNVFILDHLYREQMQLDPEDSMYSSQLRLIYGDLKTVKRLLAVKTIRGASAEAAFDRYDWLVPGLGLWHLRFNLLRLIHHIHWGGGSPADLSTLQYAADRWGRARVVEPNDFQAVEELIIHSYQARIVSIWIRHSKGTGLDDSRLENTIPWLESQNSRSWESCLDVIRRQIHPPPLNSNAALNSHAQDEQWSNHLNFCSHVETYLLLRYAIKYADIGLLRRAIRKCTIMFQADAAGTHNYARELLRLSHLVDSSASAPELQRAVLTNSLVNLHGRPGYGFETDRLLELLNNSLKAFLHERSYFSKDSDKLLEQWALNGPFLLNLKSTLERAFGKPTSGAHPLKSASEDVFGMAQHLSTRSTYESHADRFSAYRAPNLHVDGLQKLSTNTFHYNQDLARTKIITTAEEEDIVRPVVAEPQSPILASIVPASADVE